MRLMDLTDDSAWRHPRPPRVPRLTLPWTSTPDAPVGTGPVDTFGLDHDATARLHATNRGFTRAYTGPDPDLSTLMQHVPMGYTNLDHLEKVAVVLDGELLRFWPARTRTQAFDVVVPPQGELRFMRLGVSHPVRYAVDQGVNLSARLRGLPLLVVRRLSSTSWH
ncbi:MAG: hypothetical protein PGN07_00055 [Aeromicrobium erythreum]